MKMNPLAGAALALALSLSSHAQQLQIADSTGGRQIAGVGIDQAAIYNGISDARGRAQNAQGMAEWAGQTAQSASQVASAAQGTASYAVGRAADARARADYTAWYNWQYTRNTAIAGCMATGGNPIYCTVAADSMYPAP